ncbi:MAG: PKD domain-containing protein, partial [Thermoplasmata archaeon]
MSVLARCTGIIFIAILISSVIPYIPNSEGATRSVGAVITEPVNGYTTDSKVEITFNGSASTVGVGQNITNYQWYFDNGDVISGPDKDIVKYAFPKGGNYAVTLTVSNSVGETSSATVNVIILNRAPNPIASVIPPEPYAASPIVFDGTLSTDEDGYIVNWTWVIDGITRYGQSVVHTFPDNGNYSYSLTVRDDQGKTSTFDSYVIVKNKPPIVDFNWTPLRPNVGETITFTSTVYDADGTVPNTSKIWYLGDGVIHTGATTTYSYSARGTYNVTFSATDNDGGVSFITKYVYVGFAPPIPSIIVTGGTAKQTFEQFTFDASSSYDPDGNIINYVWDFGDTTTATGVSVTHAYSDGTTMGKEYYVKLNVTDNDFNWSVLTITVTVFNRAPSLMVPDVYINNSVGGGALVCFDSSNCIDVDGNIVNYSWNCGDGQFAYGPNATHWYADNGIYLVNLTATDDDGAVSYTNFTVHVQNLPPRAIINYTPTVISPGIPVSFTGLESYDPDGSIVYYQWYFSDTNTTLGGESVSHTFAANGSYIVRLTVMDDDGEINVSTKKISVGNLPPVIDAGEKIRTYYTLTPIGFDASNSYDPDGIITSYIWFFGDGTSATGRSVQHSYADDGNYTVMLTITDDDGAVNTTTILVKILNRPPVAVCPSLSALTYQNVTFNAGMSSDADGYIVQYLWKFHDGSTATGVEAIKNYTNNGIYSAVLEVIDNDGAKGNVSIEITIQNREPIARITSSDAFPTVGTLTTFYGENSTDIDGIIVNWTWYMGDGGVRYGPNVTYTYTTNGTYYCYLIVTDDDGAVNTARLKVKVGNLYPVAQITATPMNAMTNDTIFFSGFGSFDMDDPTNMSMIANYQWNFCDGTSAFGMNVTHQFKDGTRIYNVVLIVTDLDGASNSTQIQITIYNREPCTAINDLETITLVPTLFEGQYCYDTDGTIVNYTWSLGGVSPTIIGYGAIINYTFMDNGIYEIVLTIRDDDGATNSTSIYVTVKNRAPHASFTYEPHGAMEAIPVNFSAIGSYDDDGNIVTYHWIFGDGSEGYGMNISHTYVKNGTYEVILTVVDNDGDLHQASLLITVVEHNILPHAIATTNATGDIYTYQTIYFNASSSYDEDGYIKWYQWNFGDGTQVGGVNKTVVSHAYKKNNTYKVVLTVIDDKSGQGIFEIYVTVLNSPPVAYAGPDKTVL